MIALQATIHDSGITLLCNALSGYSGVQPIWKPPHIRPDLAKLDGTRSVVENGILEIVVEVSIIEDNIGIVVPSVEMSLE